MISNFRFRSRYFGRWLGLLTTKDDQRSWSQKTRRLGWTSQNWWCRRYQTRRLWPTWTYCWSWCHQTWGNFKKFLRIISDLARLPRLTSIFTKFLKNITIFFLQDWDDEMDGEWEPPMIDNPDYKGEWKPRQIDNPDYKGNILFYLHFFPICCAKILPYCWWLSMITTLFELLFHLEPDSCKSNFFYWYVHLVFDYHSMTIL